MVLLRLKSPATKQLLQQLDQTKQNIIVPHRWPIEGESTHDRQILLQKGQ